jgi:hypothetical protein
MNDPVNFIDPDGKDPVPLDMRVWHWWEDYKDRHFNRNRNNKCPPRPPSPDVCNADGRTWNKDWWDDKWRASDGSECVYDSNGAPLPDAGTYNYGPDPWTAEHIGEDVFPHFFLGPETPGLTSVGP